MHNRLRTVVRAAFYGLILLGTLWLMAAMLVIVMP